MKWMVFPHLCLLVSFPCALPCCMTFTWSILVFTLFVWTKSLFPLFSCRLSLFLCTVFVGIHCWPCICSCRGKEITSCGRCCHEKSWWQRSQHFMLRPFIFLPFCRSWSLPYEKNEWRVIFWQVRYPVLLTPNEKQIAREVCIAFSQLVGN